MTCNRTTLKLIESYLTSLNTPRSLAVWIMFRENEHDAITALDINPDNYLDPMSFRLDYLATKFLSKAEFLSTSVDKKAVALEAFVNAEVVCKKVNMDRFKTASVKNSRFAWLHSAISRKIETILTPFDGDELCDSSNWGPGVSLNRNIKFDTSTTNKFRFENGITRDLFDFIDGLHAAAYPNWIIKKFDFQIGNKIVTVPKNSKTDRTIAIEPGLNLWYQKGIGSMIRRRLRRFGLDLNSQARNQSLCRESSISGLNATIDFSQASDTISIATVKALLPPRWFLLMELCRSRFGSIEGTPLKYEKFSSMGNGFTFELESLIFYAIAISVCNYLQLSTKDVSVYGDDVIIPVKAFNLFLEICDNYGFQVNLQKSYSYGDFRESCGSHYFKGVDCKPYFLRRVVDSEIDIYLAANTIRRLSHMAALQFCDDRFRKVWRYLRALVKRPMLISDGYGDGGFIVNFDEAHPIRARNYIEGYYCLALITVPIWYHSEDHALLLARLKGRSVDISFGNKTNIRNRVKYLRKKLFIQRWANLGPWL